MDVIHLKYPHQIDTHVEATSLAIGFFDGVHRGHQAVIKQAQQKATALGVKSAVMTFDPHPSIVLGGRNERVFYITLLEEKLAILEKLGVDVVYVAHFTSELAQLSPAAFVETFLHKLNVKHVTAGFDFTFGAFGKGTMADMKALANGAYGVTVIEKQECEAEKISSTRIRQVLQAGDMEQATTLLGRPFTTAGIVVHGDKRGRLLGFPTANVQEKEGSFTPAVGVYAVRLCLQNQWFDGVCNVGYKPTFKNPEEKQLSIEVHVFDFAKDIYGEEVVVAWHKYLRNERKFDGLEALKAQLEIDKQQALDYFAQ